ncbi:MAG: hypothetical protein WD875_19015 [Pirellulales bacterium]
MSRFILIDHSLKGVGGHHYEYAAHVLRAAERAGYEPVLSTHRRFRGGADYPRHWSTWPVFRFTTYSPYTIYRSRPQHERRVATADTAGEVGWPARAWTWSGLWRQIGDYWHRRGRERHVAAFAASLAKLFAREPLAPGDQVFIPTLSELDLAGLVRYLEASGHTSDVADWHLQFHYNIFDGREPEFAAQADKLDTMRSAFADALARVPRHRLHFYNTTEPLAAQYERMGLAAFAALPYPVNESLAGGDGGEDGATSERDATPRPLRVACLGAIRPEKGAAELAHVVEELWDSHFLPGRCQLVVQSNKRRFRLPLPIEDEAELPDDVEPVVYAPHPLPMDDYVELIRSADVGLLMYDSRRYYARCSGVLVELLSVGTPVVVSAGCWMAEQIAEANFAHLDRAASELRVVRRHVAADLSPVVETDAGHTGAFGQSARRSSAAIDGRLVLPAGAQAIVARFAIPAATTHVLCSFRWRHPTEAGTYARVSLEAADNDTDNFADEGNGHEDCRRAFVVGRRHGDTPVRVMFAVPVDAGRVRLRWENEYDSGPIALEDVEIELLSAGHLPRATYPLGAVGLIAADDCEVATLLDEIVTHWPHYRRTAAEFSRQWSAFHSAGRIVAELTERSKLAADAPTEKRAA